MTAVLVEVGRVRVAVAVREAARSDGSACARCDEAQHCMILPRNLTPKAVGETHQSLPHNDTLSTLLLSKP